MGWCLHWVSRLWQLGQICDRLYHISYDRLRLTSFDWFQPITGPKIHTSLDASIICGADPLLYTQHISSLLRRSHLLWKWFARMDILSVTNGGYCKLPAALVIYGSVLRLESRFQTYVLSGLGQRYQAWKARKNSLMDEWRDLHHFHCRLCYCLLCQSLHRNVADICGAKFYNGHSALQIDETRVEVPCSFGATWTKVLNQDDATTTNLHSLNCGAKHVRLHHRNEIQERVLWRCDGAFACWSCHSNSEYDSSSALAYCHFDNVIIFCQTCLNSYKIGPKVDGKDL